MVFGSACKGVCMATSKLVPLLWHETATTLAALKWWQGRQGRIPSNLKYLFDHMPPLTDEELATLIARLESSVLEIPNVR